MSRQTQKLWSYGTSLSGDIGQILKSLQIKQQNVIIGSIFKITLVKHSCANIPRLVWMCLFLPFFFFWQSRMAWMFVFALIT